MGIRCGVRVLDMEKRFKILERVTLGHGLCAPSGSVEIVSAYPNFANADEGHAYIRQVLDPNLSGRYGLVDEGTAVDEHTRDTPK